MIDSCIHRRRRGSFDAKASDKCFKVETLEAKDVFNPKKSSEDLLIRPGDGLCV
jgi:hypothetical protein